MSHARIYKPCRSAAQSGRASPKGWLLVFTPSYPSHKNPKSGWVSGKDVLQEVHLPFSCLEEAIKFAEKARYTYEVQGDFLGKNSLKSEER